jgi:iron complex outermembrane recepter protein
LQELYAYGYPLAANGNFTEIVGRHTGYTETKTMQAGLRTRAMVGAVEHKLNFTVSTLTQERGNIFVFGLPNGVAPINSNIYDPVFVNDPSLGPLSGSIPKESDLKLTSFAFADTVSMLDDKLTLILGARVQRVKATNFDTATGDVTTSSDDQKTSPATGIVYKVSKSMSVYANYIEGFSPAPSYAANANRLLPPAVSKQVEAGTKFDFGNAGLAFSVFRIEQPNVIFDTGSGRYTQDGMQRNQGMEVSMFGEPIRNVRVLGGVMFLSGKLDKTEGGINDGNHALNVPKLNVNLGVEWDTPFIMPGLTWTARGIHTGKQWVDTANTAEIPAWSRFDVGARLMTRVGGRPVTLRATVENVADKSYWANSSLYRGAPRTFLLSGTINF